jgi:hypothetical protein
MDTDDWEARVAAVWDVAGASDGDDLRARIDALAAERPAGDGPALFERACAFDSTGRSDHAVPLYREALDRGLVGVRRRRAVIQLASSLRNLGRSAESVALLEAERPAADGDPDEAALDDAVSCVLALALTDVGREREAVAVAVAALAPHLPRYQRSMANYARRLIEPDAST